MNDMQSALDKQVGGTHYKKYKIQPIEYAHANGLGFAEGKAIKYLTRWKDKGGVEDLRKAVHVIEILIELETRGTDSWIKANTQVLSPALDITYATHLGWQILPDDDRPTWLKDAVEKGNAAGENSTTGLSPHGLALCSSNDRLDLQI